MAPTLLFITGVLAGLIAGFILSRVFGRSRSGDGSGEIRLLEERLLKADQGLAQFSQQYVKVSSLSNKSPPDFLLSTSLELENTKMKKARERRIPIVLIDQIHQLTALEHSVVAWLSSDV